MYDVLFRIIIVKRHFSYPLHSLTWLLWWPNITFSHEHVLFFFHWDQIIISRSSSIEISRLLLTYLTLYCINSLIVRFKCWSQSYYITWTSTDMLIRMFYFFPAIYSVLKFECLIIIKNIIFQRNLLAIDSSHMMSQALIRIFSGRQNNDFYMKHIVAEISFPCYFINFCSNIMIDTSLERS